MYVIKLNEELFVVLNENGSFSTTERLSDAPKYNSKEDAEWDAFQARKTLGKCEVKEINF